MSNGVDKIIPSLYFGNINELEDQLNLYKITHVITVIGNNRKGQSGIHYLCISVNDQNLSPFFSQSNDFIHEARLNGGQVMINYIGSRSIVLAAVYLMSCTSLDALSTFNALKCIRGDRTTVINPNDGFLKQLQQFEGMRLKGERRRLFQKFNGQVFRPNDEVEARKLVKLYERTTCQNKSDKFLSFALSTPATNSNWDRSKKLMIKKKDKAKDQSSSKTKNKQTNVPASVGTRISSPTKSANKTQFTKLNNKLVRSNSGMFLATSKPTSPSSPTGGVRRKLMNPSILKKQMSIDSLTVQAANLNINQQAKSSSSGKQVSISLLQPFDQKARKPASSSAPASAGRSNPELNI